MRATKDNSSFHPFANTICVSRLFATAGQGEKVSTPILARPRTAVTATFVC